jgi:hypothetical protein
LRAPRTGFHTRQPAQVLRRTPGVEPPRSPAASSLAVYVYPRVLNRR